MMLREKESVSDIVINWIIMLLIICPLFSGIAWFCFWICFKLFGAV